MCSFFIFCDIVTNFELGPREMIRGAPIDQYKPSEEPNSYAVPASSGHLVMDLNHMLRPAKSPEKCTLQLLDQPVDKLVSLFEQKTVKGWWPCTCEKNGEKIIAVSETDTPR